MNQSSFFTRAPHQTTTLYKIPKNPLGIAVRRALFGAMILPMMLPMANAELNINQQIVGSANNISQAQNTTAQQAIDAQALSNDAITQPTNAFDGIDFDAIKSQTTPLDQAISGQAAQADESGNQPSDAAATQSDNTNAVDKTDKLAKRLGFKGTGAQSKSLAKLAENYHAKPNVEARCQGVWLQPQRHSTGEQSASVGHDDNGNPLPADTIFAQADYGYYDAKEYAELSGNVIVEQNGQQVIADKIAINTVTGQATASGQVQFSDSGMPGTGSGLTSKIGTGMIGVAENLEYSTDGSHASAKDVAFASTSINAHGYAGQMNKINDSEYQMSDVMFTTCPPTERKWYLDAGTIDINSDTGRAIARNTTLRIKDVPVFYLPYFNFPIDDRRSSGFLLPTAGFGSSGGFEVSTPYYFNLAPNYDATLTPTIFTNRNPMLTGEFRYLTKRFGSGSLTGSYLPSDQKYGDQDRSRILYDHLWQSEKNNKLSAYAHYQHVSDADYLSDFDTLGLESTSLNLPRRIGASYFDENITADLRFEDFQRLDGTNADGTRVTDKDRPYARLPQFSVRYRSPKSWLGMTDKVEITGIHNSAYFKKAINDGSEPEKSGGRMYNQISASYPMLRPWGYVTPKLSLTHLYASYDEDSLADQNLDKNSGSYSVFAPTVSVDSGMFFEKSGSPFGLYDESLGGYQVLTPRLKYTYTPYKDQQNIPNFDTSISQISYDQLLSDSWFLGYDRIQDLHAITPAINYRYIDSSGRTRFDGSIAEQILLDDLQVGIDNSESFSGKSSGLAWQASIQPRDNLWLETSGALTPNYDLNTIVAQVRYQPDEHRLFNIGIIDRKENRATNQHALSAYTASAIIPVSNRWRLLGQIQYDYQHNSLLDSLVGINYEDCCYGLSVYARRYRDNINPHAEPNTAVMAEVRLNGITNGGKLNRLLSDKVLGYDTVQNAWQKAY